MVDVARYFLTFTQAESCGKCVPCRVGTKQMLDMLLDITSGKGKPEDIDFLTKFGDQIRSGSLCGLGQNAANPVLTTIRYFREEYEEHIRDKHCRAHVCKELTYYYIDPAKCQACGICLRKCPVTAITGGKDQIHIIDQEKCTKCGTCFQSCPPRFGAIRKMSGEAVPEPPPLEARTIKREKKAG